MIADATGSQKEALLAFSRDNAPPALDVGCGAGEKTSYIADHLGPTVGIDPDTRLIRAAHAKYSRGNLSFRVARAESLCFAAASFMTVFFNESLHHVPVDRQVEALHEGHRVLTARGRLIITEPIQGSGTFGQILKLYLDEKEQKQKALKALETVMATAFRLQARSDIRVEYRYQGFEDFYTFYAMTRPEAGANPALKSETRERFDRCRRNSVGDTILDYNATVWRLVKS